MTETHAHAHEPVATVEFVAGWLALDFANTTSDRTGDTPHERLHGYDDLLTWCVRAELFGKTEAARLRRLAAARPDEAAAVFARARALREAIWAIFDAFARGREPAAGDVALLNGVLTEGMGRRQLRPSAHGFCWAWAAEPDGLDWMLWPLAYSAAELLTSSELDRVKECGGETCDWLFVDVSRNRSRRWCDMKDCGNRAKARRHYRRSKAG
ncbi:MAG TPA: ABATE domain-containing protein [Gemmatimonadales bacterium]|nr:ABATE domain-containing protein [Gemmatimonadales bacterium]